MYNNREKAETLTDPIAHIHSQNKSLFTKNYTELVYSTVFKYLTARSCNSSLSFIAVVSSKEIL